MANVQQCFTRADLQAANALEPPFATASTLINPIHPIFRASNFTSFSPAHSVNDRMLGAQGFIPSTYNTITPALRLASHFISLPSGLRWWSKILLATVQHVPAEGREVLIDMPVDCDLTRQKLTEHAEHVSFRWRHESDAFASTWREHSRPSDTIICLNTEMKDFAEGEYHSSSPSHQLRFQLFLALNLCHELAHSVMLRRQLRREPFFDQDEPEAELGAAWEHCIFGGKIQPINYSMSAADGLMWFPWQSTDAINQAIQRNERRFVPVQMGWVKKVFETEGWRQVELFGTGAINIAATGCSAVLPFTDDFFPQLANP
ncbi:MAG: hypothetical protein M1830_008231 [Pleopsidium flavum]|nr:MAG: hypothetical protein M1830_008231 [Pleopsidium flavum]